jgi:hypothetical protein
VGQGSDLKNISAEDLNDVQLYLSNKKFADSEYCQAQPKFHLSPAAWNKGCSFGKLTVYYRDLYSIIWAST